MACALHWCTPKLYQTIGLVSRFPSSSHMARRMIHNFGRLLALLVVLSSSGSAGGNIFMPNDSSQGALCVHDRVDVEWTATEWGNESELVWIAVHQLFENRTVARFDVFQYGAYDDHRGQSDFSLSLEAVDRVPASLERAHSAIHCLLDGPSKIPEVRTVSKRIYIVRILAVQVHEPTVSYTLRTRNDHQAVSINSITVSPCQGLPSCTIIQVEWRNGDGQSPEMILKFSEPTNSPVLDSGVALNNAIVFNHGNLELETGKGAWSKGGEVLTITGIDSASWAVVATSISTGNFHIIPRRKLLLGITENSEREHETEVSPAGDVRGKLTVRFLTHGQFLFHLYLGKTLISTSAESVVVVPCPNDVVVAPKPWTTSKSLPVNRDGGWSSRGENLPKPFFTVEGVLAMPGDRWLKASLTEERVNRTSYSNPEAGGVSRNI